MLAVLKSRFVMTLGLLFVLASLGDARASDAPLHKSLLTPWQESKATPRPVSRREIFQAIQIDLARRGISSRGELRPGDLIIQSSLPVLKNDMGLEVKRIGFDPIRRETVFELWASHEPKYLPFEVTTRRDLQGLGLASRLAAKQVDADGSRTGNPAVGPGESQVRSKLPVLARPGRPATLVMLGQNMRVTTTVVPLQPGSKGQSILVRDPATARVMSAEVVDEGLLRTSF